jgi:hypothetical protein
VEEAKDVKTVEEFIEVKLTIIIKYTPPTSLIVINCPSFNITAPSFSKTNFQPSFIRALIDIKFLSSLSTNRTSFRLIYPNKTWLILTLSITSPVTTITFSSPQASLMFFSLSFIMWKEAVKFNSQS